MAQVAEASAALEARVAPTLVDDGLGGTYILHGQAGERLCVFKPRDEEPCAENNPKASQQAFQASVGEGGMREGILVGEAAHNESAAYQLDASERSAHFCHVPPTAVVRTEHSAFFDRQCGEGDSYFEAKASPFRCRKEKVGSLQRFVQSDGCADDFAPILFPALEVQRIAALDIRLYNCDRHGGNILVRFDRGGDPCASVSECPCELVPIDHGFCLPEAGTVLAGTLPQFEWRDWPQARMPMSADVAAYISRIDVEADAALLTGSGADAVDISPPTGLLAPPPPPGRVGAGGTSPGGGGPRLRDECVRTMRMGTLLLQCGAAGGLTLGEIADIMCDEIYGADANGAPITAFVIICRLADAEARAAMAERGDAMCELRAAHESSFLKALRRRLEQYIRALRSGDAASVLGVGRSETLESMQIG